MAKGIDLPIDAGQVLGAIQDANLDFVGRYYRSATSHWPALSIGEAYLLSSAGLKLVAAWEAPYTHAFYFSRSAGTNDATNAYRQARAVGQPFGSAIYFAVNYNATAADVDGPISEYFRGVSAEFTAAGGANYRIGVYGSGAACKALIGAGLAKYGWLALSTGWRGYQEFVAECDIKQGGATNLPFYHDSDEARDDYGQFRI